MLFCFKLTGILMTNTATATELDAFYPVRAECVADIPKTRFKIKPGKTLSARRWDAAFSKDGHLDIAKVLRRIHRGGVHPSIKGAVWEFLLGCYDPNSTFEERNGIRQQRREQYGVWKDECQKMVPMIGSGKFVTTAIITADGRPVEEETSTNLQEIDTVGTSDDSPGGNNSTLDKKVIEWKLTLHQIGLDVVRTDRALVYYESEANQAKLWDILSVYAWIDGEVGYMQGMNDICSPIIILLENEADAFWCFDHAMRRLRENFRCNTGTIGVQSQLSTLSQVIKIVDPKLHQHLEELDGGEYLFAFRMLMVLFRREFSFVDSLYLWEMMWAMEYNPNLFLTYESGSDSKGGGGTGGNDKHLKQYGKFERKNVKMGPNDQQLPLPVFLVASVLEAKNKRILKEAKGLDDVVNILGDVTGNLDAKKACNEALKLHKKYLSKIKN
ncbi:TBC1 domain family member 15-like isoform X1 [Cucurbita pepo subsp. pepo]|uniref:TBC1 domain family member 15-like isoform X1 n=2 Tax=Cucurbita pepo subsp. pepo TaxID=3664 RepID=UPI000C9D9389|nr:TBC1 domain family member 15-like isoform X1 [Cucurbita pepo subsp. pepo]XP_023514875.1 TBC1 domain family member 15-like isoform X1 [Cucurbita pepo subsp. pepo]